MHNYTISLHDVTTTCSMSVNDKHNASCFHHVTLDLTATEDMTGLTNHPPLQIINGGVPSLIVCFYGEILTINLLTTVNTPPHHSVMLIFNSCVVTDTKARQNKPQEFMNLTTSHMTHFITIQVLVLDSRPCVCTSLCICMQWTMSPLWPWLRLTLAALHIHPNTSPLPMNVNMAKEKMKKRGRRLM